MTPARLRPPRLRHAVLWIVLGWSASLVALVEAPLVKAAQARAWCVARTMVETGDWAVPRYNGEVRLKKPPLQSWVQAGAMTVAGSTDRRVAGFASWAAGLLFALGPFLLGRALGRPFAGFLGSLLLVTCRSAIVFGASPEHDVPFAGAIAVSLAALARALQPGARARSAFVAGLACGAAVLIKGPFALAFVLGTALVAGGARRARSDEPGRARLWTALLVGSLVPAAMWLAVLFVRLGGVSPVFDEMRRQALGEAGAHLKSGAANLFYYVGMIPKWAMPWSVILLPLAIVTIVRRRRGDASARPFPSFAARAFGVMLLVLTFVPAKQEHYLLPALPAAFLLGAVALENELRRHARAVRALPVALAALAVAFAAERALSASRVAGFGRLDATAFATLVALGALPLVFGRRRGPTRLVVLALVGAFGMTIEATRTGARRSAAADDVERAVAEALPRIPRGQAVLGFATGTREAFDTVAAYLHRTVERVASPAALDLRLASLERATVLVEQPEASLLAAAKRSLDRVAEIAPRRPAEKDRVVVYRLRR